MNLTATLRARDLDWIVPDWPAPQGVRAVVTTRHGGASSGPYASMNVGAHVGDDEQAVRANRALLAEVTGARAIWLKQIHGARVVNLNAHGEGEEADAAVTSAPNVAVSVQIADCLPVLFCTCTGSVVAAAHAGWRGLAAGVLEATVRAMRVESADILAWLGPAIGPRAFAVGADVRAAFCAHDADAAQYFAAHGKDKWLADLYGLARMRLADAGVAAVYGGGACTYNEAQRFFSYRRDRITGRMAALVWLSS